MVEAVVAEGAGEGSLPRVDAHVDHQVLGWKLVSCSHGQELCQLADLASDWLFMLV